MIHPQADIIAAYADIAMATPLLEARTLWMESEHFPGVWDRTHIEYVITHPYLKYAIGPKPTAPTNAEIVQSWIDLGRALDEHYAQNRD